MNSISTSELSIIVQGINETNTYLALRRVNKQFKNLMDNEMVLKRVITKLFEDYTLIQSQTGTDHFIYFFASQKDQPTLTSLIYDYKQLKVKIHQLSKEALSQIKILPVNDFLNVTINAAIAVKSLRGLQQQLDEYRS